MYYRKLVLTQDYLALKELWESSKMKVAPPIDLLPMDGWVAMHGDKIVGALFMWLASNSKVSFIGFPILDSTYIQDDKETILPILFDKAETTASYLGYVHAMHYTPLDYMNSFVKDRGYVTGDVGITQSSKRL